MSDTSVPTAPSTPVPVVANVPRTKPGKPWTVARVLNLVASLRLTVVLFVLSLMLVFFGTLAQIENGIWTVVADYFRSAFVWVPFQLFVKFGQVFFGVPQTVTVGGVEKDFTVSGSFPFFGGWALGAMLLANLLAAHAIRFKLSWKRAGIFSIHAGIIVLMLGELGTGLFAVEQRMSIATGETVAFTDVSTRVELAFLTPDPADRSKDLVVVVPHHLLLKPGRIERPGLPVDVVVLEFWKNSELVYPDASRKALPNQRTALDGRPYGVVKAGESSGVETEAREDMPAVKFVLYKKGTDEKIGGDKISGENLLSLWHYGNMSKRLLEFAPEKITADGMPYIVEMRPKREYKPYSLTLKEFRFDKYIGTEKAKNYSSLVDVKNLKTNEFREYKIYMNNPLFYDGETMYQSQFFPGNGGTVLQVVRNPVWWMPYLSCAFVTLGMMVHFGVNLLSFLQRRAV